MATSLYLLVILLPSILGQCTVEKASHHFSRSVYEFTTSLVKRLAQDTDNHFVTSPLSLWTLLSSVSLGADGRTLEEIKQVIRDHPHMCFNNRMYEIVGSLTGTNDGTTVERSSTVFIDNSMPVYETFPTKLTKTGICNITILPFVNFAAVASTINNYVSRATHETIQEIVSPTDLEGVHLILIDAIYFKGQWAVPFEPSETEVSVFYDESQKYAGDVNMMYGMATLNVAAIDLIQAKVLELPYGDKEMFSMLIFLPYTDSSVTSVVNLLKRVSLKSIFYIFDRYAADSVQVQIPRFKITSDLDNLKELLIDMGLKSMFDSNAADFSEISEYSLYISNILQKADIEVTEEGTVASAASGAEFSSRSMPDQFTANKPFLFMIIDKSTFIPLFTGAYSKPTLF